MGCDIKQDVVKHEKASVTTDCMMYVAAWGIRAEAAHGELSAPPWSSDVLFSAYVPFIAALKPHRPRECMLTHTRPVYRLPLAMCLHLKST